MEVSEERKKNENIHIIVTSLKKKLLCAIIIIIDHVFMKLRIIVIFVVVVARRQHMNQSMQLKVTCFSQEECSFIVVDSLRHLTSSQPFQNVCKHVALSIDEHLFVVVVVE